MVSDESRGLCQISRAQSIPLERRGPTVRALAQGLNSRHLAPAMKQARSFSYLKGSSVISVSLRLIKFRSVFSSSRLNA